MKSDMKQVSYCGPTVMEWHEKLRWKVGGGGGGHMVMVKELSWTTEQQPVSANYKRSPQFFIMPRRHLQIQGAKRKIWNKFHTEDSKQTLGGGST